MRVPVRLLPLCKSLPERVVTRFWLGCAMYGGLSAAIVTACCHARSARRARTRYVGCLCVQVRLRCLSCTGVFRVLVIAGA
jgi:hypothetical protein